MPDTLCPICQRPNDSNAERCWYCQAVLPHDSKPEKTGNTDWLNALRDESVQSSEPETLDSGPEETEKNEEGVPDWLARIRELEQMERETQPAAQPETKPEEKKEDLPDWLREIKAGNSGKKAEPVQQENGLQSVVPSEPTSPEAEKSQRSISAKKEEEETEEWLSHLAAWKPDETETNLEGDPNSTNDQVEKNKEQIPHLTLNSLSEWDNIKQKPGDLDVSKGWQKLIPEEPDTETGFSIDRISEEKSQPKQAETTDEDIASTGFDVDALHNDLTAQEATSDHDEKLSESTEVPIPNVDDHSIKIPEDDKNVSRIFEMDHPAEETGVSEETAEAAKPFYIDEIPENPPFLKDDLPDWLATAALDKTAKKTVEPISEELDAKKLGDDLEKANLPAWLQAIRPTNDDENIAPVTHSLQNVETQGMLAGIADTLQSPKINGQFRKPVGYGSTLKVSERQKSNANLFASLVEETLDEKGNEGPKKSQLKKILWRSLMAAVMIGIILLAKSLFGKYTIQPALFAPEVVAVYDTVNSLPTNAPVLLTGDFEPAVTGELTWSSQILLEHLMRRGLNLVILSTSPTGSTILSEMLETASQKVPGYDLSTHVVNLGYLPGASSGLQSMTENLRAAMPFTHDFQIAWDSAVLQSVSKLSDFGAVIVLSDKAESARVWIEQIQPKLDSTPLMFVISAQAAPMLQPYYQSTQISGFIAGFNGSLTYEKIFQQPSSASDHQSAFQASILFLTIILLLGGLVNLIRPAASKRKR